MHQSIATDKLLHQPPGTAAALFNSVRGIQVRADVKSPYDTFGTAVRHVGPVLPETMETVENWATEFQRLAHIEMSALVLCSVWREAKVGEVINRHAEGRALDIGGVWLSRLKGVTAWGYSKDREQAIGLEASLRLFFGTVLGPTANKAHAHHWHVDIGRPVELTAGEIEESRRWRKVEVVFIQDALVTLFGHRGLAIDGYYGPKTRAAASSVLAEVGYPDGSITSHSAYKAFLRAAVYVGWGVVEMPCDLGHQI
jgi:hypothetical protein